MNKISELKSLLMYLDMQWESHSVSDTADIVDLNRMREELREKIKALERLTMDSR